MSRSPIALAIHTSETTKPHPCPRCHDLTFQVDICLTCLRKGTQATAGGPESIVAAVRAFYDSLADQTVDALEGLDICSLVEDLGRIAYPDQSHLHLAEGAAQ